MEFPAKLTKSDGCYVVSFPDFPNINTFGETKQEALQMASEALNACFETDFERGFFLPEPKAHKGKNAYPIKVLPHIEIAYTIRKLRNGESQEAIAGKLGISYQAYQKLENPRKCNPTIKTLEKIGNTLGKELVVSFR